MIRVPAVIEHLSVVDGVAPFHVPRPLGGCGGCAYTPHERAHSRGETDLRQPGPLFKGPVCLDWRERRVRRDKAVVLIEEHPNLVVEPAFLGLGRPRAKRPTSDTAFRL